MSRHRHRHRPACFGEKSSESPSLNRRLSRRGRSLSVFACLVLVATCTTSKRLFDLSLAKDEAALTVSRADLRLDRQCDCNTIEEGHPLTRAYIGRHSSRTLAIVFGRQICIGSTIALVCVSFLYYFYATWATVSDRR